MPRGTTTDRERTRRAGRRPATDSPNIASPKRGDREKAVGIQNEGGLLSLRAIWEITQSCNLDCIHCCVSRYAPTPPLEFQKEILETIIDWPVEVILVGGGEPFLNAHAIDLLSPFHKAIQSGRIQICTNGQVLNRRSKSFLEQYTAVVRLSVHSLHRSHNFTRGQRFDYAPLLEELTDITRVIVNTALTKVNVRDVIAMVPFLSRIPIFGWAVYHPLLAGRWLEHYQKLRLEKRDIARLVAALDEFQGHLVLGDGIRTPLRPQCDRLDLSNNIYIDVQGRVRACYARPDLRTRRTVLEMKESELLSELRELTKNCPTDCRVYAELIRDGRLALAMIKGAC